MVDLSELAEAAASKDTKERLKAITDLGAYVGGRNAVDASSAPVLMEVLLPALGDNNLKVVQGALGTLAAVVDARAPVTLHLGRDADDLQQLSHLARHLPSLAAAFEAAGEQADAP